MESSPPPIKRPLWGSLEPGPYPVGFETSFRYDFSRTYDPKFRPDPTEPAKRFRPLLINVWYPAAPPPDGSAFMPYREYFRLRPTDPYLEAFARDLSEYTLNGASEEVMRKPFVDLDGRERAAFERFLDSPTACRRDPEPLDGPFPLVLNHQGLGGVYDDNTVLFEYLASHGYVVANSAFQSTHPHCFTLLWDLETSFKDMDFLVNVLRERPHVDLRKVGVMGQSYGAQAAMAWRSEGASVADAVISLDSTLEYTPPEEERPEMLGSFKQLKDKLRREGNMTVPMLIFGREEGDPNFGHYAPMKFAERYYGRVKGLGHNDFIAHGVIGREIRHGLESGGDASPTPVREAYDRVCLTVLRFLDAHLKRDAGARGFLRAGGPDRHGASPCLTLERHAAEPPAPTAKQLLDVVLYEGVEKALELCQGHHETIDAWSILYAGQALARRDRAREAAALLQLGADWYPKVSNAHEFLGQAYERLGDFTRAVRSYQRQLETLPKGENVNPVWSWMREQAERKIGELKRKAENASTETKEVDPPGG